MLCRCCEAEKREADKTQEAEWNKSYLTIGVFIPDLP